MLALLYLFDCFQMLGELEDVAKISVNDMERNWCITAPRIIEIFKQKGVPCTDSALLGELHVSSLLLLRVFELFRDLYRTGTGTFKFEMCL